MAVFSKDKLIKIEKNKKSEKKHTVLIVDDEIDNLKVMDNVLSDSYKILKARNGMEAYDLVKNLENAKEISLIISDQRMPKMTGVELFEKLMDIIPDAIRIIVTGFIDVDAIIDSVNKVHIYKFILKPYERMDFLWTIKRAIESYEMKKELDVFYKKTIEEKEMQLKREKEIQRLKQKLETKKIEYLEESNRMKDDFLRMISHELRTPLNGIDGSIILAKNYDMHEDAMKLLDTALDSSADLLCIIDKMLYFSELQANSIKISNDWVNVSILFDKFFDLYCNHGLIDNIKFKCEINENVPDKIVIDKEKMFYVIGELIINAFNFTKNGEVILNVKIEKECLLFQVKDTGTGISDEKLDNIFEIFKQADMSYERQVCGLGMGLPVCNKIVKLMQGSISVDTMVGGGSCFSITLPFLTCYDNQIADDYQDCRYAFSGSVKNKNLKILVVEDNKVNQMILVNMIKNMGHEVHAADNGIKALEFLNDNMVDFIFMDLQMPEMDGFDTSRRIHQMQNANKNCPIAAVTANVLEKDKKNCIEAGINYFIKKPIKIENISNILENYRASAGN